MINCKAAAAGMKPRALLNRYVREDGKHALSMAGLATRKLNIHKTDVQARTIPGGGVCPTH